MNYYFVSIGIPLLPVGSQNDVLRSLKCGWSHMQAEGKNLVLIVALGMLKSGLELGISWWTRCISPGVEVDTSANWSNNFLRTWFWA